MITFAESDTSAKITVDSLNAEPGTSFNVKIKLENNPGIVAADLKVSFDEELTLIGAVNGDTFSKLTYIPPRQLYDNVDIHSDCHFVWYGTDIADSDIKDGTVLTLRFKLSKKAKLGKAYNISVTSGYGDVIDKDLNSVILSDKGSIKSIDHVPITIKSVAATCTKAGKTSGTKCSICGTVLKAQKTVKATGHNWSGWKTIIKATYIAAGTQTRTCSKCKTTETKVIARLKTTLIGKCTIKVKNATYTGKALKPAVTIKNGKTVLKAGTHYTVTYRNNQKIGKATVTIKGVEKNGYSGTKKLTFNIVPANVKNLKVSQTTSTIKLSWSKVSGATGYRVYKYDGKNKKWVKVADTKKVNYTVRKLKAGTSYKYAVKAYAKSGSTTYWSAAYVSLSTATKPATPTLKVTAGKKQAVLSWNKISGATGYEIYMSAHKDGGYKKVTAIKKNATVKYTKKNLKKGTIYYFKVRAYKTVDGKNIYSAYSVVKNVKVK